MISIRHILGSLFRVHQAAEFDYLTKF